MSLDQDRALMSLDQDQALMSLDQDRALMSLDPDLDRGLVQDRAQDLGPGKLLEEWIK